MKQILKYLSILSVMLITNPDISWGQSEKKKEEITAISELVASRNFVFEARSVSPVGGPTRQLTSYYDLTVKGDTVISFLPYFGRAYAAPMSSADAGIRFTSTNVDYESKTRRKGGWDIIIKPDNATNVQQMNLRVFENGHASLQVTSNNRQPISFLGTVAERRRK